MSLNPDILNIQLTPYQAMSILKFLSEFESDFKTVPQLKSFYETYKHFEKEVGCKITEQQFIDALMECKIKQALGTDPPSSSN